jgi:hypothetical protein
MADRIGAVIVFRAFVSEEEAANILDSIKEFIDLDQMLGRNDREKIYNTINEFDDGWGGPVWYLP